VSLRNWLMSESGRCEFKGARWGHDIDVNITSHGSGFRLEYSGSPAL
jgi:hypothetical protein